MNTKHFFQASLFTLALLIVSISNSFAQGYNDDNVYQNKNNYNDNRNYNQNRNDDRNYNDYPNQRYGRKIRRHRPRYVEVIPVPMPPMYYNHPRHRRYGHRPRMAYCQPGWNAPTHYPRYR